MEPVSTAALLGLAKVGSNIAQGAGQVASATAMFDAEDRQRLKRLQTMQRRGALGLNDTRRARLEGRQAVERGGFLRQMRDQQSASAQALANQGAVSGRDLFLMEAGGAEADAVLRGEQAQAMAKADIDAARAQRAEIEALKQARKARQAGVRGGLTQMLVGGAAGAASGALDYTMNKQLADQARDQRTADVAAFKQSLSGMSDADKKLLIRQGGAFRL